MKLAEAPAKPTGMRFDREALRKIGYGAVDQLVDNLPLEQLETNSHTPTLRDASTMLHENRDDLMAPLLCELVCQIAASCEQKRMTCPGCGSVLLRKRMDSKRMLTYHGEFTIERAYFYCEPCKAGYHPLDEMIDLAREVHQHDVQAHLDRMAADRPYVQAVAEFERHTKQKVSASSAHEHVQMLEKVATMEVVLPTRETIEGKIAQVTAEAGAELPVMGVALDGAFCPIRGAGKRKEKRGKGFYRDVKGFRIFVINRKGRIVQLASWHNIEPLKSQTAITEALQEVASRIPIEKVRPVLLGDGAAWIWKVLGAAFPNAKQLLDHYHLNEHLWAIAKLIHPSCEAGQRQWVEAVVAWTWEQGAQALIELIEATSSSMRGFDVAQRRLLKYIGKHANRLGYQAAKNAKMPRGSGSVESAHKFLAHQRLKVSGAWWLEANANTMLHLRCALYNGTFEAVFEKYVQTRTVKIGNKR